MIVTSVCQCEGVAGYWMRLNQALTRDMLPGKNHEVQRILKGIMEESFIVSYEGISYS